MRRAYSLFEVKEFDEKKGQVIGIATSIRPDRLGDIVEPRGAKFALPLPLLSQHMTHSPVGHVVEATPRKSDIPVVAQLVNPDEARSTTVRERLLAAWDDVRLKLVRGFSIGFNDLIAEPIKDTFSLHFKEWEWLELSLVTIPANADATIQTIKTIDTQWRAASGRGHRVVTLDPTRRVRQSGVVYLK